VVERADVVASAGGGAHGKSQSVGSFSLFRRIEVEPDLESAITTGTASAGAAIGTATGFTGTDIDSSSGTGNTSGHRLLVDRLAPATAHAFRFRVANAQGVSLFSECTVARTAAAAPRAPKAPFLLGGRSAARTGALRRWRQKGRNEISNIHPSIALQ
jgi:hypothetical protein